MPKKLGINQIGSTRIETLIAGDFPTVTEDAVVSGSTDLVAGSVVIREDDGTISLASGDPDELKVYGVAAEPIAVGDTGVIWRTGQFVRENLTFGSGTWEDWIPALPDVIFFQSARTAPNQ